MLVIPSWYPQHSGDIGGSFFREQALALNKHGCKVGVIYPQLRSLRNWKSVFTVKRGISVEDDSGVMTYRSHGMNWFPRLVNPAFKLFLLHGRRLYEKYVFENGVPDVVHAHSLLNAGLLAYNINKKHGVPYVVTEHSSGFASKIYSRQQLRVAGEASISAKRRFAV
ncbi:MAG: glycosyltransferase, partial [Firmicutes bacterium]|nr:glycosyltransferase [Bacillota bacterium]